MGAYHVRFVHKITPRDTDVMQATLPDGAFSDRKALGKALRDAKVMHKGCRVEGFRVEGNRIVVFPICPGLTTYWHSIILTVA